MYLLKLWITTYLKSHFAEYSQKVLKEGKNNKQQKKKKRRQRKRERGR